MYIQRFLICQWQYRKSVTNEIRSAHRAVKQCRISKAAAPQEKTVLRPNQPNLPKNTRQSGRFNSPPTAKVNLTSQYPAINSFAGAGAQSQTDTHRKRPKHSGSRLCRPWEYAPTDRNAHASTAACPHLQPPKPTPEARPDAHQKATPAPDRQCRRSRSRHLSAPAACARDW